MFGGKEVTTLTPFVPIAMFGCPLVMLFIMAALRDKRKAMLFCLVSAWLFMPQAAYIWPGPLQWTKINAVSSSLLFAVAVVDGMTLLRFRLCWFDFPVLLICMWPAVSAFGNGLGLPDAVTSLTDSTLLYGVPYFLGRVYITDAAGIADLARAMLGGGLCYVPLCLFEIRMSPMLHYYVYGFFQHQWLQMVRDGGYRPIVFMQHGLAVAMWMGMTTVLAFGVWRFGVWRRLFRLPVFGCMIALATTSLLCKSAGAIVLTVVGCLTLELARRTSPRWLVCVLLAACPAYMLARSTRLLSADDIAQGLELIFPRDRVASAEDRLHQEDVVTTRVESSPIYGLGPWGAFFFDATSDRRIIAHSDSMWVITLGKYGFVGLTAAVSVYLVGPLLLLVGWWRRPAPRWEPLWLTCALISVLAMYDNLSNFMPNPMFVLGAGAVATFAGKHGPAAWATADESKTKMRRVAPAPTQGGTPSLFRPGRR